MPNNKCILFSIINQKIPFNLILRGTLWGTCFSKMVYNEMKMFQKISKHWRNN